LPTDQLPIDLRERLSGLTRVEAIATLLAA
jgi:hypothetical protein